MLAFLLAENLCKLDLTAIGAPTKDEIPWHNVTIPNADVSCSKPIKSTILMDLSETNTAAMVRKQDDPYRRNVNDFSSDKSIIFVNTDVND